MTKNELHIYLEEKVVEFNTPNFLSEDPIGIVHQFSKREDIEIMGLFMATIAWGNRKSIIKSGQKLVEIFEKEPYQFILNHEDSDFKNLQFVHRTFQKNDLQFFAGSLRKIYQTFHTLENVFEIHSDFPGIKGRIINFRKALLSYPHEQRSEKHVANPLKNSAAKRINMFLRWMVRDDENGVDFGIWKSILKSELYIPLDVHTSKIGRKLGLITRKQDDWKALEELMLNLKEFDSKDPCKYDFALFGLGAIEKI